MAVDVLVVDDDEDIRFSISEILRDEGYAVAELSGGERVLELLQADHPKLVLLDLSLPGTDIEALAARIRDDGWIERTTILVVSGLEDAQNRAAQLGFHGTVRKPFDVDQLIDRVAEVFAGDSTGSPALEDRPHA